MKKRELLQHLEAFADDDEVLVESIVGGYEEPVIYVKAIRSRTADEMRPGAGSEYVADRTGKGKIILGTHTGCTTP